MRAKLYIDSGRMDREYDILERDPLTPVHKEIRDGSGVA